MELTEILYTHEKQITIHRQKPDGSVEVLLGEFDRKNPHKSSVIKDRYVIDPDGSDYAGKTNLIESDEEAKK